MNRYLIAAIILAIVFIIPPVSANWFNYTYNGTSFADQTISSTYASSKAFDNDPGTGWFGSFVSEGTAHIGYYYSTQHVITAYTLLGNEPWAGNFFPKDWKFEGSNDNVTYVTLDTQTGQSSIVGQYKTYNFTNSDTYRYYKLNITKASAAGPGVIELQLWGDDTPPYPTASFIMTNITPCINKTTNALTGYPPFTAQFSDTSTGSVTSWVWNATPVSTGLPFTFNQTAFSITQYTFTQPGNYSIKLNASSIYGTNISAQSSWVNVTPPPPVTADFTANTTLAYYPPGAVAFTDISTGTPTGWLWDFGDNTTSTSQNPTHAYTTTGLKTVSLYAYRLDNVTNNDTRTKPDYINVTYSQFYVKSNFVGNPASGSPGLLVSFTDQKIVGNASAPLTCNWSFGDSLSTTPYSSTCGNVQHVYTYSGIYDVNYSVTMWGNTSYEYKQQYITVSTAQSPQLQVYPKFTTFHVKSSVFGAPLEGVNVSVRPVSTSMGEWDWVGTLLGLPIGEVNLDNTSLYQTTDSYGMATFFIVNTQKYNVTFTKTGYTINPMIVVPQDDNYIVTAVSADSEFYRHGEDELTAVNISITTTLYNTSHAFINMTYYDATGQTTGGYIQVIQKNDQPWTNPTVMATWPVTGNSFSNSTTIVHIQQVSGQVKTNITHNEFGTIVRSYPYQFNSVPVEFLGFGRDITLIVALGIMLFTMMLGAASHSRIMVVIVSVEGWIFYTMHWFQSLFDRGVPEGTFTLVLTLVFLTGIIANILMRKKRGL
jgi:PKD repeat protein